MSQTWDRNQQLAEAERSGLDGSNLIIRKLWIFHHDYEIQGDMYARAKTFYERTKATLMTTMMTADVEGKKLSAAAAEQFADADPDVWKAALAYRQAEQMASADKHAMQILQAELDAWQTKAADDRASNQFMTRNSV